MQNEMVTYVHIPHGSSKRSNWKIQKFIIDLLNNHQQNEGGDALIKSVLTEIEKNNSDTFLDFCLDKGYTTQKGKKVSSEYWCAMIEAANL